MATLTISRFYTIPDVNKKIRSFVQQQNVHDPAWIAHPELADVKSRFFSLGNSGFDEMSGSQFLKAFTEYEKAHERHYAGKKMRYGVWIDLMLPIGNWEKSTMLKIARRFAKRIQVGFKGLKWFAFYYYKGKATYIRLWISDREKFYVPKLIKPVYKRNIYVNAKTGVFCSKKDEDAVLAYRKGAVKKDAKPLSKSFFAETKTRLFAYSTRPSAGKEKRTWLLNCAIEAMKGFGIDIHEGFMFKRRKMKRSFSLYVKRCVIAENKLQIYTEDVLNRLMSAEINAAPLYLKDEKYMHVSPGVGEDELMKMKIPSLFSAGLIEIYEWLENIFAEGKFTYKDVEYKFHQTRVDLAEQALRQLRICFDRRIKMLDLKTKKEVAA